MLSTFLQVFYSTYLLTINVVRTSITDINETDTISQDFVIYPNPTSGKCMVTFPDNGVSGELRLFNVNGEIVMKQQIVSQTMTIDLSHLASGIYSVAYLRDDKMVAVRKVIRK